MQDLIRITADELPLGPLPFTVYDQHGRLLYGKGIVLASVGYHRFLLARGIYRKPDPSLDAHRATSQFAV